MWRTRTQGIALLCLWTGMVSWGCGRGSDDNGVPPEDTVPTAEQGRSTTSASVALHVQMTGLLMLVRDTGERTHVAATRMADHKNYIGFSQDTSTVDCDRFHTDLKICYVLMDNWLVDSIGPMGSPGQAGPLPSTVFDLTASSGGEKVNVNALGGRSTSMITFFGGSLADTCSLAEWTFDPPGQTTPPVRIEPVNRLGWRVPDIGADSVLIIRRKSTGVGQVDTLVAHANSQGVIELLILNIPPDDTLGLFRRPPTSPLPPKTPNPGSMGTHVRQYYAHMGLPSPASHPVPEPPIREIRKTCPITILGLENDTKIVRDDEATGIRTQSCIIATATPG
jgi:hypothetical protein